MRTLQIQWRPIAHNYAYCGAVATPVPSLGIDSQTKLFGGFNGTHIRGGTLPISTSLERFKSPISEYIEGKRDRMRYPEFRKMHLFVGSGVIEAGCKAVIGSRLKQSGMSWTVRGANAVIALGCCLLNGELEDYWAERRIA